MGSPGGVSCTVDKLSEALYHAGGESDYQEGVEDKPWIKSKTEKQRGVLGRIP